MTSTIPRLTTRGIRTAEHIRDRKPFTTSGSLRGEANPHLSAWDSGRLYGADLDAFRSDLAGPWTIDYIVWSYDTPIAWALADGSWYVVQAGFSPTTGKHKGNLYLIPRADHQVETVGGRGDWRVVCATCGDRPTHYQYKADAHEAAHSHRVNGRTT